MIKLLKAIRTAHKLKNKPMTVYAGYIFGMCIVDTESQSVYFEARYVIYPYKKLERVLNFFKWI
jgi:hypothetical protein